MPEIAEYRITVGNNTNVTATTKNLTAEQQKALQELQKMVPGDISISADGVVSITSQKGLALFNSFCQQNNISDTHGALMQIDVPEGTTLPLEGLKNASAFCTSFGRGETDPSKMSLTELMTFMLMMTYASEEEHRRVLSEVKATQLQIAMEVAINTWESSREAAEKTCNAETLQAWGTVASGVANAFIAIGSAVYTPKASASKREQLASNKYDLAKNQSLQDQQKLQTELEMADSQQVTIEAKQAEINTEIQQSEKELTAHQQKKQNEVKVKNEEIAEKNEAITEK
ncbi:MAG: hypothetical protein LBD34_01020, partial [Puniceicoccales bacterium]|nr:hypothetical protein [Puniceicoccales bacterium]